VSGDFRVHPVAILMAGVFEHHDRRHFEISGITFGLDDGSGIRARIAGACEHFIDVRDKSDFEIATLLCDNKTDIVVDLMGPTAGCRPGIFAARPAPVQVNYLGYSGTMSCGFMDYILADATVIPQSEKNHYSEKIAYLPDSYMASDDKRTIAARKPARADFGLPETGFVFCSFNHSHKFTPEMFAVWMRILRSVEGSVLWLPEGNKPARRNLSRAAEAHGVAPERLVFAPFTATAEDHLARLSLADLFLDTLPCNAHATASDALWAGLPLLTCKGSTFAGRIAASLLCATGLRDLVTESIPAYEALAVSLAHDRAAFAELRERLARSRNAAPLFDTARFTRGLETAFTKMRSRSRLGQTPQSFAVGEALAP
jgi:predicted O-linked N-acetylglucosamine transferase (SPINDLY family)